MRKKALALTGAAASGALVLGTVGGAYACDLPGDAASAPVSSNDAAAMAARINQIEALAAKYSNDPKVAREVAAVAELVQSYFADPTAYQSKLANFEQTAAYQRLQDKLAAIRAAAAAASSATPSTTPVVPSPGTLPPTSWTPHFWFHHHGWHDWGFGGDYGPWSGSGSFGHEGADYGGYGDYGSFHGDFHGGGFGGFGH